MRKDDVIPIHDLVDHLEQHAELTARGISALICGLLDFVVDGYFTTVQSLDEQIEILADLLFDQRTHDTDLQRRSFEWRKGLARP